MYHTVKYKVVGVDAVTGEKRRIEVEADCEKDALLWAREIGILTSGITPVYVPIDHPPALAESPELRTRPASAPIPASIGHAVASPRQNKTNPAAAFLVAGFFAVVFLVCSGVLNSSSSSSPSEHNYTPTANLPNVQDSTPYSPAVQDAAHKWGVSDDRMQHAIDQIQAADDYRIKHNVPDPRDQP